MAIRAMPSIGYLIHTAGYNLGLIMRLLVGAGTPRELLAGTSMGLMLVEILRRCSLAVTSTEAAMLVITCAPEPTD